MLRKIRVILASIFFILVTLLFLDYSGTLHLYLGWMAKVQFLPAVLALNVVIIAALVVLTLVFGRIYCSVICPLGVLQDIFGWMGKKAKKNRYTYSKAKNWLRYTVLGIFILAIVFGIASLVALLAPYSSYGRIAQNLLQPVWIWGNNVLAYFAERADSYTFYHKDVLIKSLPTFIVAVATFVILLVLAWRNCRTYCNTICPVGTVLGTLARFSIFRPAVDKTKCVNCNLCVKNCKASCIDIKNHKIDYSRCVVCGDCISKCKKDAISYTSKRYKEDPVKETPKEGMERRAFIATASLVAVSAATAKAQEKLTDGGLAPIVEKEVLKRETEILPPGAVGMTHFSSRCTGCQLCVSKCPNNVLRPSADLMTLMQPRSSYEKGFCRPECTVCSEVCPTGAIKKITREEKSSIQIGHAVWDAGACLPMVEGITCGNCGRHCPTGAISMVAVDPDNENGPKFPVVDENICIGCGACEYVCPVRPVSAIYVEGHQQHKLI